MSHVFPYPLHDGGRMDVYHRLQALKKMGFETTLLAFYNPAFSKPEIEPLQSLCVKVYPIPYLRRNISKMLSFSPYTVASKENWGGIDPIIQDLQVADFSALLLESHHVLTVAKRLQKTLQIPKTYLRVHNHESRFMKSVALSSPLFSLRRPFFLLESLKYHLYEKTLMKTLSPDTKILHISFDEKKAYQKKYPTFSHHFLPAGCNLNEMQPYRPKKTKTVLFAGALFSPNNIEAITWYLQRVHSKVLQDVPDVQFVVAGTTKGADLKKLRNLVQLIDTPTDLKPIYEQASVFVNPMQQGAGVKVKTIHALLHGLPIVSTQVGNEGTGLQEGEHLLIGKDSDDFAQKVITLLRQEELRQKLVQAGQQFLQEHYNQEMVVNSVLRLVKSS